MGLFEILYTINTLHKNREKIEDGFYTEGSKQIKFVEPEYPYIFDFEAEFNNYSQRGFFSNLAIPDFLKEARCMKGTLKVKLKKSGNPIILHFYFEVYPDKDDDEQYVLIDEKVYRNDLNWPDELIYSFANLARKKAEVIKSEKIANHAPRKFLEMKDYVTIEEHYKQYEYVRNRTKQTWNEYMEEK